MSTTPKRSLKRTCAGVSAGALALTGLATGFAALAATSASATPGFTFHRLAGSDRFGTAAAIATNSFKNGADTVLIANGDTGHFPDALSGNYLAGQDGAPILLTHVDTLPTATSDALTALKAKNVVILGQTSAVGSAVEADLKAKGYSVTRVGGVDRYATARDISESKGAAAVGSVGNSGPTALLASGQNFPDALVAGPLGYAGKLPVEITDPNNLSAATKAALQDLNIKNVIIAGGDSAVSQGVQGQVSQLNGGITITRLSGVSRTETATAIANFAVANLGFTKSHVNLARGDDFPDALTGGPHAGAEKAPIILANDPNTLGTAAAKYLTDNSGTLNDGNIFGGTSAISDAVASEATKDAQGTSASPTPSASSSPTPSPSASSSAGPATANANPSTVGAGGTSTITANFPGAPSGSNVTFTTSGAACGTISPNATTTDSSGNATTTYTAQGSGAGGSCTITATGPNGATATTTVTQTATPAGQTVLPQLVSASIIKTVTGSQATASQPAGTYVQYVFNQDVSTATINATGFHVFDYADNRYDGAAPNVKADKTNPATSGFSGGNANAVDVVFTNGTPSATAPTGGAANSGVLTADNSGLTLATVGGPQDVNGAAVTKGSQASPDGQATIGKASNFTNAAGVTNAPDPESISAPRTAAVQVLAPGVGGAGGFTCTAASGCNAIDVTFNEPAYVVNTAGFQVLYTDQSVAQTCSGPASGSNNGGTNTTSPSGNGTTTLTIVCPNDPTTASATPTAAQIARVIVLQNTVTGAGTAATAVPNPLEVTDTPHAMAQSPSLTSVVLTPGSNTVTYTFDRAIVAPTNAGGFGYYTADATQVTCAAPGGAAAGAGTYNETVTGCTVATSPTSSNQVAVTFPAPPTGAAPANGSTTGEQVAQAVGGNVATGTVTASGAGGTTNAADELGASNVTSTAVTPGTVNAPQLTAVKTTSSTNSFGNTTFGATYTFSQPVTVTANTVTPAPAGTTAAGLHVYDQDGTEFTCANAVQGTAGSTGANTVNCSSFVASTPTGSTTAPTANQAAAFTLGTADFSAVVGAGSPSSTNTNPNPEGGVGTTK